MISLGKRIHIHKKQGISVKRKRVTKPTTYFFCKLGDVIMECVKRDELSSLLGDYATLGLVKSQLTYCVHVWSWLSRKFRKLDELEN